MSTLVEIENAAAGLPPGQKQELMLFLAARLRADGARPPEPRIFKREQIDGWMDGSGRTRTEALQGTEVRLFPAR